MYRFIDHEGSKDPTTEGWKLEQWGAGSGSGSAVDDGGVEAWRLQTDGLGHRYLRNLAPGSVSCMEDEGWHSSITLRVDTVALDAADWQAHFEVVTNDWAYGLMFGSDNDGNILLRSFSDMHSLASEAVPLGDIGPGFHTFTLSADPGDGQFIDLYVDGEFLIQLAGAATVDAQPTWMNRICWGDTDTGGSGIDVYYSNVDVRLGPLRGELLGDANSDSVVDELDAAVLAANWQADDACWAQGDFNNDGNVDERDATILAANWQKTVCNTASAPEPSTVVLLFLAATSLLVANPRKSCSISQTR